ncbi:MAG: hypothetical protein AB1816_17545 [Bacillota bacterium]
MGRSPVLAVLVVLAVLSAVSGCPGLADRHPRGWDAADGKLPAGQPEHLRPDTARLLPVRVMIPVFRCLVVAAGVVEPCPVPITGGEQRYCLAVDEIRPEVARPGRQIGLRGVRGVESLAGKRVRVWGLYADTGIEIRPREMRLGSLSYSIGPLVLVLFWKPVS